MSNMPRVQKVVLPILRTALVPDKAAKVGSWGEDIDFRVFPFVNVRRVGGFRHDTRPNQLALPIIELTAYGTDGLVETEELYEDALEALYEAVRFQTQTPVGYLHSIRETIGAHELGSPFIDSWCIQGEIRLGVRPPRSS